MKNRLHLCAELLSAKPLPVRQTQAFELGLRIAKKKGKELAKSRTLLRQSA